MHSGISATAVVAVLLNLLFNEVKAGNRPGASVFAAAESEKDELGDTLDDELRGEKRPVRGSRRPVERAGEGH
jgi:hypothetical protein